MASPLLWRTSLRNQCAGTSMLIEGQYKEKQKKKEQKKAGKESKEKERRRIEERQAQTNIQGQ